MKYAEPLYRMLTRIRDRHRCRGIASVLHVTRILAGRLMVTRRAALCVSGIAVIVPVVGLRLSRAETEAEVAPADALAAPSIESVPGHTAQLPDGVTIELVGVSPHPSDGQSWWRPDGTPLASAPYCWHGESFEHDPSERVFEIVCRVTGAAGYDRSWIVTGGRGSTVRGHPRGPDGRPIGDLEHVAVRMPLDRRVTNVHMGLAAGAWETAADCDAPRQGYAVTWKQRGIIVGPAHESDGATAVSVTHGVLDLATRLMAFDRNGRGHPALGVTGHGLTGMRMNQFTFPVPLKDVTRFEFQARPFRWVAFRNVSLAPGEQASVQVYADSATNGSGAGFRDVFLPDADVRREKSILDLASGELMGFSKDDVGGGPEAVIAHFRKLGKGDLAFDRALICMRGARAVRVENGVRSDLAVGREIMDWTIYKLPKAPFDLVVTSGDGVEYDVSVLKTSDEGASLRYRRAGAEPLRRASSTAVVQKMIDDAEPGAVVVLPRGRYDSPLRIEKPLTLMGEDADACILDMTSDEPAIVVNKAENVTLMSLTVRWRLATSEGGPTPRCAVYTRDSAVTIGRCRFVAPGSFKRSPQALVADGFSNLTVDDCRFEGHEFVLNVRGGAEAVVRGSVFLDSAHCAVTVFSGSTLTVTECIVTGSKFHALRCTGGSITATDNLLIENANRGIYLGNKSGEAVIRNNLIMNNATGIGGFANTKATIERNVIAGSSYAGIGTRDSCRFRLDGNVFADNTRGIVVFESVKEDRITPGNNTLWNNATDTENWSPPDGWSRDDPTFVAPDQGRFGSASDAATHGLTDPDVIERLWKRWQAIRRPGG